MKQIVMTLGALLISASTAFALDLDAAKAQGLVGETRNGYVAAVNPTAEVNALVMSVNEARKAEYAAIAAQNGQDVSVVEKLAAAKAYELTAKGHFVKDAGGNWVKK